MAITILFSRKHTYILSYEITVSEDMESLWTLKSNNID